MKNANERPEPWEAGHSSALGQEAFHGVLADIVRKIEPHTEADPASILLQLLAGVGHAVGPAPHYSVEGIRHGLNLYVGLIGASPSVPMAVSWHHAQRALRAADPGWAEPRVASGVLAEASLEEELAGEAFQALPPGDRRLLTFEPALSGVIQAAGRAGGGRNTLASALCAAWDGAPLRPRRRRPARNAAAGQACACQLHLTVVGHVTRGELAGVVTPRFLASGVAPRFLWAECRRSKLLPSGGGLDRLDLEPEFARLGAAVRFGAGVDEMRRDDDADALWREHYKVLTADVTGPLGGLAANFATLTMRVACLFALLDESRFVRREHLLAALRVVQFSAASAHAFLAIADVEKTAQRILEALEDAPDGLTRTDIRDLFHNNKGGDEIVAALSLLAARGLAYMRRERGASFNRVERWFASSTQSASSTQVQAPPPAPSKPPVTTTTPAAPETSCASPSPPLTPPSRPRLVPEITIGMLRAHLELMEHCSGAKATNTPTPWVPAEPARDAEVDEPTG